LEITLIVNNTIYPKYSCLLVLLLLAQHPGWYIYKSPGKQYIRTYDLHWS